MLLAICCRVMPSLAAFQVWGETYVFVNEQPAKQTTAKRNKVIVYFMVLMWPSKLINYRWQRIQRAMNRGARTRNGKRRFG